MIEILRRLLGLPDPAAQVNRRARQQLAAMGRQAAMEYTRWLAAKGQSRGPASFEEWQRERQNATAPRLADTGDDGQPPAS
ncbi:MAG: hypothetical protein WBA88_18760 [Pseudaminobacter sp.]